MTFDQIWKQLSAKEPKLNKPESTVSFNSSNLKKLLRQVYEQGQNSASSAIENNPFFNIFKP